MTRREQTIVDMLIRWREALEGGTPQMGAPSDSRAFELPPTWTWAYRELERLLLQMRRLGRQQAVQYKPGRTIPLRTAYWHVREWYIDAESRPAPVMRQVTLRGGRKAWVADPVQRRIVYRRHPDAREEKALAGVRWLAAAWSDKREPELPREFLAARPTPKPPRGDRSPNLTAPLSVCY